VPYGLEELVYTYKIRTKPERKIDLIIIAVSKAVVVEWYDFFVPINLTWKIFDIKVWRRLEPFLPRLI